MKTNLLLSFILLFINYSLNAQINPKTKWGDVSQTEIDYKQVPFEKDAGAVILYEEGTLIMNYVIAEKKVYKRIKILDESGLNAANQELIYYSEGGLERIDGLKAQTLNFSNGKTTITEVDRKSFFDTDINQYYNSIKFAFPNVQVGSILEFEYTLTDKKLRYMNAWEFQHEIPTLYSKFNFKNDSYIDFRSISIGEKIVSLSKTKREPDEWAITDVPSLKQLKFVYNSKDVAERLVFQIQSYLSNSEKMNEPTKTVNAVGSWGNVTEEMANTYNSWSNNSSVSNLPVSDINQNDQKGSLLAIIEYFKNNYNWNNFYAIYPKITNREVINQKKGNAADLNLLLNVLLNEKGFDAKLLMISTRDNKKLITSYPYIGQFNSTINMVKLKDGSVYFFDASDLDYEFGYMPLNNYNQYSLLVDSKKETFINMEPPLSELYSNQSYNMIDGKFILSKIDKANGYFNSEPKNLISSLNNAFEIDFIEKSKTQPTTLDNKYIGTKTILQANVENQSFLTIQNPLQQIINQYKFEEKTRERQLEFDFPFYYNIDVVCKIPEGYSVEIPMDFNVRHEVGDKNLIYYQNAQIKDNSLVFHIEFLMQKSIFINQFPDVKRFFEKANSDSSKSILLKKS